MKPPLIIAHRTSPAYAPENSLAGIRVSLEQGADGVEVDLRCSLDSEPFLMHDNTMRRTTGWPLPIELTPSRLVRQQTLEGSLAPPPTLPEALDALPERCLVAIDVKTPWAVLSMVPEIKRRGIERRTLVWCASARVASWVLRRLPGCEVAYYKDYAAGPDNIAFIERARRLGVGAVSLDWRGIDATVVSAAHEAGLKVYSWHKEWTITEEKLASGLDGLITDYPARARAILE